MREALALAEEGLDAGELPIAAVVVLRGEVISKATTGEKKEQRLLVHAEQRALEEADKLRLPIGERRQAMLFTNLEPCLMCLGAAMSFFLGKVYYGLESPSDGAVALVRDWVRKGEDFAEYRMPETAGGVLREQSLGLFEKYVSRYPTSPLAGWARSLVSLR
jgi:tRNA(adenine34) deaminase